jgi:hypothetical protein
MRLSEWVDQEGKGEQARLKRVTGLSYTTIQGLRFNRQPADYDTGKLIVAATKGAVTLPEVCELPNGVSKPRPKKKRAPHKRKKAA